jgi:hypothetical protein
MKKEDIIKYIAESMNSKILWIKNEDRIKGIQARTVKEYLTMALEDLIEDKKVILGLKNSAQDGKCPNCGHRVARREISLYKGLYEALVKVYQWCKENKTHTFKMHDIRHLIGQINYTRFGDWVYFGGLIYKEGKANYGMNIERTEDFLFGSKIIQISGWKDPITGEFTPARWGNKKDIPGLQEFLDDNGLYRAKYTTAPISLFDKGTEDKRSTEQE